MDNSSGMAIIKVEDQAQVEEIIRQDPAIIEGIFTAELRPWFRVNWEKYG